MKDTPESQQAKQINQYLLGQLSEEEQLRFEEEYFANPGLFQEIRARRDDLIDGYLRGELAGEELEHFKNYFLASPRRRNRVAFSEALVHSVDRGRESSETIDKYANRRMWIPSSRALFPRAILAAAALVIIVLVAWFLIRSYPFGVEEARQTPGGNENRQVNTPPQPAITPPDKVAESANRPSDPTPIPPKQETKVATFVLSPNLFRDSKAKSLIVPADADYVQLELETEVDRYQNYRAFISTPEGIEKSRQDIKGARGGARITLRVPARVLSRGDYILRLNGVTENGGTEPLTSYYFRVDRR